MDEERTVKENQEPVCELGEEEEEEKDDQLRETPIIVNEKKIYIEEKEGKEKQKEKEKEKEKMKKRKRKDNNKKKREDKKKFCSNQITSL